MKYLLALMLTTTFISCSQKQEEKQENKFDAATIEKEVKEMFLAYDDSVRKLGINGEFFFLDNSDQFYWVPPGYKYALHYDSIARILHEFAPQYKYIDNSWDDLQIMALSEKYASFNGLINSYIITIDNDTIITKLSETGIVVKRENDWKFLSGQTVIVGNEQ